MAKIKSIWMDFQLHRGLRIDLHPNVNVIRGTTDSGKSAIIRAIEAVALNMYTDSMFYDPAFDPMSKEGAKPATSYKVTVETDAVITKIRKQQTSYEINGQTYNALGRGEPIIIHPHLKLHSENIQTQHKPYFLINPNFDGPSAVAASLNKISGMGDATRAIALINSKIRQEETKLNLLKSEQTDLEKVVENLAWTEDAMYRLRKIRKYQILAEKIYEFRELVFKQRDVSEFVFKFEDLLKERQNLVTQRAKVAHVLKKYNSLKVPNKPIPNDSALIDLVKQKTLLIRKKRETAQLLNLYNAYTENIDEISKSLKNNECPLCKTRITN